jgi:AGZA family xanthine/uracil permease-like MFS transporter
MLLGKISPRLLPPGWHDLKEPYDVTAMVRNQDTHGSSSRFVALLPPWMRKLITGNKRFWAYTPEEIERHLEGRQMTQASGNAAAEMRQQERDRMREMLGIGLETRGVPEVNPHPHEMGYDVEIAQGSREGSGIGGDFEMEGKEMNGERFK